MLELQAHLAMFGLCGASYHVCWANATNYILSPQHAISERAQEWEAARSKRSSSLPPAYIPSYGDSDNRLFFSLYLLGCGSEDGGGAQVSRLGGKCLYPLSQLIHPGF